MKAFIRKDVFKTFLIGCNLSQKEFAREIRMKPQQLSDLVRGHRAAGPKMRIRIEEGIKRICGKSPKDLFRIQR